MDPKTIRDQVLGHLYPVYGKGKTQTELSEEISDAERDELSKAIAFLIEKELVRPPAGYGEFATVGGSTPMEPRFDITAKGVEYLEEKTQQGRKRDTGTTTKPRGLPSLEQAEKWALEARRYLSNAEKAALADHADSVAHSAKTIEFAAKSMLALVGYRPPEKHEVGRLMTEVIELLQGDDASALVLAKRHAARVGWLCDVAAPLQQISEYGYADKSASEVVNETDAKVFLDYGRESVSIAGELLRRVRVGSIRIRS